MSVMTPLVQAVVERLIQKKILVGEPAPCRNGPIFKPPAEQQPGAS